MTHRVFTIFFGFVVLLASPFVLAEWRLTTSTDSMTDKETKRAEARNEGGYSFSIYRTASGAVYGNFSLPDKNLEVLDTRLPMYRVDKLPSVDLNSGKSISKVIAEVGGPALHENKPKWVNFLLFHGKGDPNTGTLREIMGGKHIVFRYWLFGGGYRETSFDLSGANLVIAAALDVSAEVDPQKVSDEQKRKSELKAAFDQCSVEFNPQNRQTQKQWLECRRAAMERFKSGGQ